MNRTRVVLGMGTALVGAIGFVGFACGFPDVAIATPDAAAQPNPSTTSTATLPPGDDAMVVTPGRDDEIDANAPCPGSNPCDCDNDGYLDGVDAACGGDDCNDRHASVHPNMNFVAEPPNAPNKGDWDCSGGVEKQYATRLSCGLLGKGATGFLDDPDCGVEARYYECSALLAANDAGLRRQGCK